MATPGSAEEPFGRVRGFLWPIQGHELRKLLPMLLMFFFISLVYSLLRNTKDTLIVTAPGGGAGLIPFLKVYGTIPGSVLIMLAYGALSDAVGKRVAFTVSIGSFMAFFLVFALVFPLREALEPSAWALRWQGRLGPGLGHLVAMVRHWLLALFYVMAELWGSVALSLLFWGFANDITKVEESKRFYALFGIGANLALVAVKVTNQLTHLAADLLVRGFGMASWNAYVDALMAVVILCGAAILGLHHWIHIRVLPDPRFAASVDSRAYDRARPSLGFREGLQVLLGSRYLGFMAILVMAYGIAINLVEVTWKNQLGIHYPTPGAYQDYMADFALATGLATLVLMLFVSSNVLRRFGWTAAALITPLVLLVTGIGFFGFILFQGPRVPDLLGVHLGFAQNVMSKASKYSLFDPTKEMAYIPLDPESKVRGKAAIDVVGARLGKAGGSLIQLVLIGIFGSLGAITAPIGVILLAIIGLWIWAVVGLGREFKRLTSSAP